MFCRNCGTQLEDGARFCPECGTQVVDLAAAQPAAPVEQPTEAAPQQPEQPAAQSEPQPQPAAQQQPAAAYAAPQPQYAPQPAGPQYAKGCLAQAFSDMTKVKGVLARVCQIAFLPALIGVVSVIVAFIPIVGWLICPLGLLLAYVASVCGSGYAIEWGRDLTRGEGFDINKPLLRSSAFALGIFASALTTVLNLVAWVPSTMFDILAGQNEIANLLTSAFFRSGYSDTFASSYMASSLDVLSGLLSSLLSLASVVFTVIFGMVSAAAVMRLAMTGRIESAFSLGKVWKSCKKELGKLFCATVLADLLVGLVAFLVLLVVTIVFIVVAGSFSAGYVNSYSSVGYSNYGGGISGFLGGLGSMLAIYLVIVVFVVMFSSVFGSMLKYRALGHWAARYAEGWTDDNDPDFTIYLPGDRKPAAAAAPAAPVAAQTVAAPANPAAAQPAAPAEPAPAAQPAAEPAQAAPTQQNPFGPTDPGPLA